LAARFTFIGGVNERGGEAIPTSDYNRPPMSTARDPLFTARFAGLWLFAFVTFFSAFQLLPVIPFRILELGGSTAAAGWFLTVYTCSSAFAAPVMGTIADHIGRRRLLIIASLLFIGFSLLYGVITYLPLLLVVGAIHGCIWSGILASSSALITDMIPISRRTEGIAYWGLSSTAAVAIAPAAGLFVYHFGWLTLCVELAILSLCMTLAATALRDSPTAERGTLVVAEVWDWRVVRTTLTLTAISFGYGGITSYAAIFADERHVAPRWLYFAVFASTVAVVRIFTSRIAERIGPMRVLYPALALIPIAFAVLSRATTRQDFAISAMLFGAGLGTAYPSFITFVLAHTDPARRARTFGSVLFAFDTGIGTGSLLIGVLGEHYGLGRAFGWAAALACLALPIFWWSSRQLANGTAVASTEEHA
jgi:predicted MFS family arabinose efflux permease